MASGDDSQRGSATGSGRVPATPPPKATPKNGSGNATGK